jgi:hypothetical protein
MFLLLQLLCCFAFPSESSAKPGCKHSGVPLITMNRCLADSCNGTSVSLQFEGLQQPATYRLISGNKADDQSGAIDSTARLSLSVNNGYSGEYFLEIKSAGCEPLMLEGIRFKQPATYRFEVCLAKGTQLQRYKYLGENKRNLGVLESLN